MKNGFECIVVGLGAFGAATLYQLSRLGVRALGLDQFSPAHSFGSSHGETRITRESIGEGAAYVPLVRRSHQIWRELESQTGQELFSACGGLIFGSGGGVHHGQGSFVEQTTTFAKQFGIAHESLTLDQLKKRYPQFKFRGDEVGYFEPGAGFVRPERCIETQLNLATKLGGVVHTNELVIGVKEIGSGNVEIVTNKARYQTERAIVCAGPWASKFLPAHFSSCLKVFRQVLYWFDARLSIKKFDQASFPIYVKLLGGDDIVYGFPAIDGPSGGIKIVTEQFIDTTSPDSVSREVSEEESSHFFQQYVEPNFNGVSSRCLKANVCLYTVTPDSHFIIDWLPESSSILFASPCSGHGFKHSASIGEALAKWSVEGSPGLDLRQFSINRAGLI